MTQGAAQAAQHPPFDLIVIGGGINGCGIARDAAGRGLSVMLVEQPSRMLRFLPRPQAS